MEKTADQWVEEGDKLDDAGKREEAMKCFDTAIGMDPKNARAYFLKGYLLEHMSLGLRQAAEHYQKAIDLGMDTKLARRNLGGCLMATGQVQGALDAYLKALEMDPKELRDLPDIGVLYGELGNDVNAMKYFDICMERDPKSIRGNSFKAGLHMKKGEIKEAIKHFRVALAGNPKYESCCYNIGKCLMKEGQTEEAMTFFNRVSTMAPANADQYCYRGQCYLMLGRKDEAFVDFRKAQELLETDKKTLLAPNFIKYIRDTLKLVLETEDLSKKAQEQMQKMDVKSGAGLKFATALQKIQEDKKVAQMKALDEINKSGNDRSNTHLDDLDKLKKDLEAQIAGMMHEMNKVKTEVSTLNNRVTNVENNLEKLKEEVDNKFDDFAKKLKKELDKIDMSPDSQAKVNAYFKAFVGTFSSAYTTAQVINSGQVSLDNGSITGTVLSTLASFAPFVGSGLSATISTVSEFLQEKKIKTGARKMQNIAVDGSALSQMIGKTAFQILMDSKKQKQIIEMTNEESKKVADDLFKNLCKLVEQLGDQLDTYLYGALYQSPPERIGHADANTLIEQWMAQKVTPFDVDAQFVKIILNPECEEKEAVKSGANTAGEDPRLVTRTACCNIF